MQLSERMKLLIGVSILILIVLIVLTQIKKTVPVSGTLKLSHVGFKLQNDVPNFLGVSNTSNGIQKLNISAFSEAILPYQALETLNGEPLDSLPGELEIIPDDPYTSSLRMEKVNLGNIELNSGYMLTINSLKEYKNSVQLAFTEYSKPIEVLGEADYMKLDMRSAYGVYGPYEDEIEGELYLALEGSEIMSVTPAEGIISLNMEFNENESLVEEDVLMVNNLRVMHADGQKIRSGIIEGDIYIGEANKHIHFGKNKTVLFDTTDVFEITELVVSGDHIKITFDGETDFLSIGHSGNNFIPHLLKYLSNNNFLMIVFNSYMIILTFFISLRKSNKDSLKAESKESDQKA